MQMLQGEIFGTARLACEASLAAEKRQAFVRNAFSPNFIKSPKNEAPLIKLRGIKPDFANQCMVSCSFAGFTLS